MPGRLARSHRSPRSGGSAAEGRPPLAVGDLLAGKYRVDRILGEGGMGVVVAARHEILDQHVAVKLLYRDVADREAQTRLLQEARACAKMQSEHVARVLDADIGPDRLPFIVMELLEGRDLCEIADERGALPRWLVVDYILQTLEGLAHAHARGIVHRDLKPSNLFLANRADGSQIIKILDFGVAKSTDSSGGETTALTTMKQVLGSPPYMSPEQIKTPRLVDPKTDIWALGICMYELLSNTMPFGGSELHETFEQIVDKAPAPLRMLVNGIPDGLERAIMRCLAKRREERFADVGELARAIAPFGSGGWSSYPDRIAATLTHVAEEKASNSNVSLPRERVSIPASPRGPDSMQPSEFHGTSSTLHGRFLDPKKRLIVAAIGISAALAGAGLITTAVLWRARRAPPAPAVAAAFEPPPESTAAGPRTAVPSGSVRTASPENELPGVGGQETAQTAQTALGASPTPPSSGKRAATPPPAATTGKPAMTKKPPPAGSTRPGLPVGLPLTRQ